MLGSHPVGSRYSRSRLDDDRGNAKNLADEWRAPTTAPVTVRDRSRPVRDIASLAFIGEPGASRSSGGGGGEP